MWARARVVAQGSRPRVTLPRVTMTVAKARARAARASHLIPVATTATLEARASHLIAVGTAATLEARANLERVKEAATISHLGAVGTTAPATGAEATPLVVMAEAREASPWTRWSSMQ